MKSPRTALDEQYGPPVISGYMMNIKKVFQLLNQHEGRRQCQWLKATPTMTAASPAGRTPSWREPFVVMFSSGNTAVKNFVLIPQHTSPDFAVQETDALYDVVKDVRARWSTNDIVLLGDFNNGCSYVTGSDWEQIRLFTDKSFHWLIPDSADTTVSHTNCAYDRIVVSDDMMKNVVPGSAEVYDFMEDLKLSHSLALAVSDHYPVEVKLAAA